MQLASSSIARYSSDPLASSGSPLGDYLRDVAGGFEKRCKEALGAHTLDQWGIDHEERCEILETIKTLEMSYGSGDGATSGDEDFDGYD